MNKDDIIYIFLLCFSIAIGYFFKTINSPKIRQHVGTILGFGIVFLVSGYHILHPIIATAITILILQFVHKRLIHGVSFVCLFLYLFFFRMCHYVGLPMTPSHTNAIQMVLTLKLVGLCFEVHDSWKKKEMLRKETDQEIKDKMELELKWEEVNPSPVDVMHYAFCYIGVLTGPYFKYRVYHDMLMAPINSNLDFTQATLQRIKYVPLYAVLFLISGYFFPLSFAESQEIFFDYNLLYRVWYMTPVFFNFRMRIYAGFVLSECVCIMAGLGAYPKEAKSKPGKGPTDYHALQKSDQNSTTEVDFETIHNIDEYGSEFTPTVRGGIKCWNMTVQYWLASNVYRRLTMPKPLKEVITMFTSAFWHGVYSGYYLSMLTVPFILAVEDFFDRLVRRRLSTTGQWVYDWFSYIHKMQQFAYMGMAFLLLRVDTTLHYWRSIGFIFHGVIVIFHGIAQYVNLITSKIEKKLAKSKRTTRVEDTYIQCKEVKTDHVAIDEDKKKK